MSHPPITPEERFATIVEELLSNPGVTPPSDGKGFGSSGLKIQNKIFAMLVRDELVVKLPKPRWMRLSRLAMENALIPVTMADS